MSDIEFALMHIENRHPLMVAMLVKAFEQVESGKQTEEWHRAKFREILDTHWTNCDLMQIEYGMMQYGS